MLSLSVVSDFLWPHDCSLPGSSVHGILQARILEWVAISFSRGSSQPRVPNPCLPLSKRILLPLGHLGSPGVWIQNNYKNNFIAFLYALGKLQILWPPDAKSQLIRKDPDATKDWGQEEKGRQRTRWLNGITDSMEMSLSSSGRWWRTGKPGMLQFMGSQRVGQDWVAAQQPVARTS